MIDLRDTTFIIPVRLESKDRQANLSIVLNYLCKHLDTNIIIFEDYKFERYSEDFISSILFDIEPNGTSISYMGEYTDGPFHRTKYLNQMLAKVKTDITVNYDVDILLKPETYLESVEKIRGGVDMVYPFFLGMSQYQVNKKGRNKIKKTLELGSLSPGADYKLYESRFGHCQFVRTDSYKSAGGENEGFISYAPEDVERCNRFHALGYRVVWNDSFVYHLEHERGVDSSFFNPMMKQNFELFDYLRGLSAGELKEYYKKGRVTA